MSTRATIAVRDRDGFASIYLHFDGYPSACGKSLRRHYTTFESVSNLIGGGDLRSLDPATGVAEHYSELEDQEPNPAHTETYAELAALARESWSRYLYVFDDGRWSCEEL